MQGGLDPLLWMSIASTHAYLIPTYKYDLSPFLGVLNSLVNSPHSITIEIAGLPNWGWWVTATLLVWRSKRYTLSGPAPQLSQTPLGIMSMQPASTCQGDDPTKAGLCSLVLKRRSITASTVLTVNPGGLLLEASSRYTLVGYNSTINFNKTSGAEEYWQTTSGQVAWYLRMAGSAKQKAVTSASVPTANTATDSAVTRATASYDWLNHGGFVNSFYVGSSFEASDNATMGPYVMTSLDDTIGVAKKKAGTAAATPASSTRVVSAGGSQKHYFRAELPGVVDPVNGPRQQCPDPPYATVTASVKSSVNTMTLVPSSECVSWVASGTYCYANLLSNTVNVQQGACAP